MIDGQRGFQSSHFAKGRSGYLVMRGDRSSSDEETEVAAMTHQTVLGEPVTK